MCALAVWLWVTTYVIIGLVFTLFVITSVVDPKWPAAKRLGVSMLLFALGFPFWLVWFLIGSVASSIKRKDMKAQLKRVWSKP